MGLEGWLFSAGGWAWGGKGWEMGSRGLASRDGPVVLLVGVVGKTNAMPCDAFLTIYMMTDVTNGWACSRGYPLLDRLQFMLVSFCSNFGCCEVRYSISGCCRTLTISCRVAVSDILLSPICNGKHNDNCNRLPDFRSQNNGCLSCSAPSIQPRKPLCSPRHWHMFRSTRRVRAYVAIQASVIKQSLVETCAETWDMMVVLLGLVGCAAQHFPKLLRG